MYRQIVELLSGSFRHGVSSLPAVQNHEFHKWFLKNEQLDGRERIDLGEIQKSKHDNGVNAFTKRINECQKTGDPIQSIHLRNNLKINVEEINISGEFGHIIGFIGIELPIKCKIENCTIYNLNIRNKTTIHIENCFIKKIDLKEKSGPTSGLAISMVNCCVGELRLNSGALSELNTRNCLIGKITCPVPTLENPFKGPVSLTGTRFSNLPLLMSDVQQYRNLRYHLSSLENTLAEGIVHSKVLRMERAEQDVVNRIISYLYQIFSDFGNSTVRPLVWLFATTLASCLLVYFADGAVQTADSGAYIGWRNSITERGEVGRITRSMLLGTQSLVNPLGIFSYRSLVVPSNNWIAGSILFQGILSPVLLFLFIFALRRRFKMK